MIAFYQNHINILLLWLLFVNILSRVSLHINFQQLKIPKSIYLRIHWSMLLRLFFEGVTWHDFAISAKMEIFIFTCEQVLWALLLYWSLKTHSFLDVSMAGPGKASGKLVWRVGKAADHGCENYLMDWQPCCRALITMVSEQKLWSLALMEQNLIKRERNLRLQVTFCSEENFLCVFWGWKCESGHQS